MTEVLLYQLLHIFVVSSPIPLLNGFLWQSQYIMFDKFCTGADEVRLLCFILFPVLNCGAEHCDNAYYCFICFFRLWFWRVWCWMHAEMWSMFKNEWL